MFTFSFDGCLREKFRLEYFTMTEDVINRITVPLKSRLRLSWRTRILKNYCLQIHHCMTSEYLLSLSTQTVVLNCLSHFWRVFFTDGAIFRLEQCSWVHHHGGFFSRLSKTVTGSLLNCCSHHGFRSHHAPSSTPPSATVIIPTFTNYSRIISSWINDGSVLCLLFSLLLCFFSSILLSLVNSNNVE